MGWRSALCVLLLGLLTVSAGAQPIGTTSYTEAAAYTDDVPPPLPRWREGGTPFDPLQPLTPFAIRASRDVPTSGVVASPAEYDPVRGVLFKYITGHWTDVVTDCVVALTADPLHDEIAYVVVNSAAEQTAAYNAFNAAGADMSKVQFIISAGNSVWMRDYGPHFITQDDAVGIVDSHYYPTRSLDNFVPTVLGDDHFIMPTYDIGLYYSGGNLQPGPNRSGYLTTLINVDNPASAGFDAALIADLFKRYQGLDTLHIFPQLPSSVDGTGHIDMWMYIVDEENVIVSQFQPGSNATAIQITDDGAVYMAGLGFNVYRTPAWNAVLSGYNTNFTYTNALRVNDRIFIPTYGLGNASYLDEDAAALAAWEAAAGPGVEIVPIDCYPIIWAAGAIHCIVMQVPRHTGSVPAVHVISPDGGDLLAAGATYPIEWVATDTDNVPIPQIDLYYSLNNGASYDYIATTTNTGSYPWTVPVAYSGQALIRVVATSADTDQGVGVSAETFTITPATQTVYDFATGAGTDKFAYGYQTANWTVVDGVRKPVNIQLNSTNYTRLSTSNATGGSSDTNRYISPNPSNNYESTHVFEFTIAEDPADIGDIEILWEGFANDCTQVELYVWDYVAAEWSDGAGAFGQNYFFDNWAGNRDGYLNGHLRADFDRYIDASGQMTLLVYGERGTIYSGGYVYMATYHDYLRVTVTTPNPTWCLGDMNCSGGTPTFDDIKYFSAAVGSESGWWAYYRDNNGGADPACPWLLGDYSTPRDGVDFGDIKPFAASIGQDCVLFVP